MKDFVKFEPDFPNSEYLKGEELIGKTLEIKAVVLKKGETSEYFVILANVDGKEISFSNGGAVIVDKLKLACKEFKMPCLINERVTFPEEIRAKLVYKMSPTSKRMYYTFE